MSEMYWKAQHWSRDAATVPGTEEVIRTGSSEQTWQAWNERCKQLGLQFDNPYRVFDDCCCQALSPALRAQACAFMDGNEPAYIKRQRIVGMQDVFRFLETAADWWKSDEAVPQELANKRAETCQMCPHNTEPEAGGCPTCTGIAQKLVSKVFGFLGGRSTPSDPFLKACELCGCSTSVLCWTPLNVLLQHQEGVLPAPSWCWKVTEQG